MQTQMDSIKLLYIGALTALKTSLRRWRHGPVSPKWSAGLEIAVDATRAMIIEMNSWPPERMQAVAGQALPGAIPDRISFSELNLGGVRVEKTSHADHDSLPIIFYMHGGGTVLGSPKTHRQLIAQLALESNAHVYAPYYRLAPQHPFPAAFNDVYNAYIGMLESGIDPERVVLAGDSAGGLRALSLLHRLNDSNEPLPAGAITFSPAPDLTMPGDSWIRNLRTDYLSREIGQKWINYYATEEQRENNHYISTILGDFSDFPPTMIQVGGGECVYDDVVQLKDKMEEHGAPVTFEAYDEMPHVWQLFRGLTPEGDQAIRSAAQFVQKHAKVS